MDNANDEPETADDALDPALKPKDAKAWLALIATGEKAFDTWQAKADSIDKLYANLERLASLGRDREFQLFWANVQVLGPSIYSRPPVPVVVPRFKDRKPVPRAASEVLERSAVVTFETESIDETMRLLRDDMTTVGRGAPWVRYEAKNEGGKLYQCARIDHVNRRDFLHDPARSWKEVDWVAKRSWLTRKEARKRFKKTSGDAYQNAAYEVRKDEVTGETDNRLKAGFWELWSKSANKVVWISEGVDVLLDEGEPHLKLEGFFPCPRPAYATVQRNSLVPVPDMLFYKDQLEEINEITARISALSESLKLRGFYPAGAGEIGDAIEAAIKSTSNNQVLVPIANWAALGANANPKDMILWLPLDMVATTIQQLIELRKQLIDDVYQITGLSDIMRGSTVASETLGAQELKSQYGSIRIRDRQDELIRVARDLTRIVCEIMAENFSGKTLLAMSQLEIHTEAEVAELVQPLTLQLSQLQAQLSEAQADPEIQQLAEQQPDKAQQVLQAAQQQMQGLEGQIDKLRQTVTIEQVMRFLRDHRIRAFTLDIETDSTIAPDENAQKQRAAEYITAMSGLMQNAVPAVQAVPQAAPLVSEIIRFANAQFRVGRQFEQTVEEFTDQMKQLATAPKNEGPNPEQIKAQAEAEALKIQQQLDAQKATMEAERARIENAEREQALAAKQADEDLARRVKEQEAFDASQARDAEIANKQKLADLQLAAAQEARANAAEKHQQDMEKGALEIALLNTKIQQAEVATDNSIRTAEAAAEAKAAAPQKEPA